MPAFYVARAGNNNAAVTTNGQVGITAPGAGSGWFINSVTATANQAYLARVCPRRNMNIVKIGFVTTQAANSNDACDVGIYSSDLTTKLVSAGATSAVMNATAGPQSIAVSSTGLTAGTVYYLAFSYGAVGGTAAKLLFADFNAIAAGPNLYGTAAGAREIFFKATSHPLPSSLSGASTAGSNAVLLTALES